MKLTTFCLSLQGITKRQKPRLEIGGKGSTHSRRIREENKPAAGRTEKDASRQERACATAQAEGAK